MKKLTRMTGMLMCLALCASLFTACAPTNPPPAPPPASNENTPPPESNQEPKTIVYGLASTWTRLMPYDLNNAYGIAPVNKIFDQLVYQTADGIGLRAAKSISVSEDRKTYTITLHDDSYWHDGEKVTSADWLWTFETMTNPQFDQTASLPKLAQIAGLASTGKLAEGQTLGVEAPDDYTLVLKLSVPMDPVDFFIPANNYISVLPKHLLKDIPLDQLNEHEFWSHPVGSGPCKFVSQSAGTELVLEAFDDFYLGRVAFDQLIYRVVDYTNASNALLAGDIDTVYACLPNDEALALEGQNGLHVEPLEGTTTNYQFIINNERYPAKVRKAFDLLIDKELIFETIFGGQGYITNSLLLPTLPYSKNVYTGRDVEKAKALLAEANFDFSDVVTIGVSDNTRQKIALIVQQNLAEADVKTEIVTGDSTTIMGGSKSGELDTIICTSNTNASPIYMMPNFNANGKTWGCLTDIKYYDLMCEIAAAADEETRKTLSFELQDMINEECPWLSICHQQQYMVESEGLDGCGIINADACWLWTVA